MLTIVFIFVGGNSADEDSKPSLLSVKKKLKFRLVPTMSYYKMKNNPARAAPNFFLFCLYYYDYSVKSQVLKY